MADWKNLKAEVDNKIAQRQMQAESQQQLDWSKQQNIQQIYDWLHKKLKDEEIHTLNRELLLNEIDKVQIRYKDNIINLNQLWLEIGTFRYEIKAFPIEFKITARLNQYRHPNWLRSISNGAFDLDVTFNGESVLVKDQTGNHQKSLEEIPDILLSNLYRASRYDR